MSSLPTNDIVYAINAETHSVESQISEARHKLGELSVRVSEAGNLFQREELEDKRLNVVLKGLQQSLGRLEKRVESLMRVIEMEKASTSEGGRACDVVELVERGGAKMYWLKWTEGLDSKKKSCEKVSEW
jgi:hypothetical protein